jgi:hypothetical protein
MLRPAAMLLAGLAVWGTATAEHPDSRPPTQWNFDVYLDDREIGFHRFQLSDTGDGLRLDSRAEFAVKLLLVTVFSYDHRNTEIWRDGCLQGIEARTDSNGRQYRVSGVERAGRLLLSTDSGERSLDGCIGTFAYWDRQLMNRAQLLNAQTGELLPVRLEPLGAGSVTIGGRPLAVQRYALAATGMDIELAYAAEGGDWVALDSRLEGGKFLRYRRSAADLAAPAGIAMTDNMNGKDLR